MSINTIKATIQMRRGLEQDFDADQMTAGEWAVSTDKKYVRMCFAPGIVVRMATYEGFEQDMQEIQTILTKCEAYASEAADYVTLSQENAVQSFDFSKESGEFSKVSKSYAVGGTGTRTNENIDNAKYYYEQSKTISERLSGALRPMGTVTFANLPALSNVSEGDMYNISDKFTTNENFKEGSGHVIPAGSNVYKTADEKWDVLAGTPVSTVNGQTGDIDINTNNLGYTNSIIDYLNIDPDYNLPGMIGNTNINIPDLSLEQFITEVWNVLIPKIVTKLYPYTLVKGNAEQNYKHGYVNLTPEKIGLGNVGNFKAVSTEASQGLSDTEKSNARANIDAFSKNGGPLQGNLNMEENDIYDVRTIYSPSIPIDIMSGDDNNGSSISLVNRDIKVKSYENGTSKEFSLFQTLKNIKPNSATNDGLVLKGEGHPNQVWKTDENGVPGWRNEGGGLFVSFTDGTWKQINTMLNMHYAGIIDISDYWSVGDEKTITVAAMNGVDAVENQSQQNVTLVIVDFNKDNLVNPIINVQKAAVTIGLKNTLSKKGLMNLTDTNLNGWNASLRRSWCNDVFYNALPEGLKMSIKQVAKTSAYWNNDTGQYYADTNDLCWLASAKETNNLIDHNPLGGEGVIYEFYKISSNCFKTFNGQNIQWWLRSMNWGGNSAFKDMSEYGNLGAYTASSHLGIAPHFCI